VPGEDVILVGAPGCACAMILGVETPGGIKAPESVPCHMALLTNVASVMTGMKRYYNKIGRDVKVVSFVGDGATADIGFQPLSGAADYHPETCQAIVRDKFEVFIRCCFNDK